ncbi:hypothetical protein EG328_000781 [Venturia inaequalis]|uniref:Uncharacterized protein n=1 Tax=Venturia inaequalis TaxID=5025 RepID=A0A8H3YZJ3_VENIN|nr:hypothetical protein EG328_000781 [Venturia inaequalis]KAE9990008.1 hypothetical protein EG327_001976 [Venturia inaequalis]RDI79374.1 hypothetical protein Vi05172_g10633 [Venturia inaequalis]
MVSIRVHRHRVNNTTAPTINMEKLENGQVQATPQQQQFQQQQFQQHNPQQQMYNQGRSQAGFTPVSPVHQQPYQPAMSPPPQRYPTPTQSPAPQYIAPHPHYPVQSPPHGVAEAPAAEHHGMA